MDSRCVLFLAAVCAALLIHESSQYVVPGGSFSQDSIRTCQSMYQTSPNIFNGVGSYGMGGYGMGGFGTGSFGTGSFGMGNPYGTFGMGSPYGGLGLGGLRSNDGQEVNADQAGEAGAPGEAPVA